MPEPVWLAMIRGGMNAYIAARQFGIESDFDKKPVWCAERFGQSVTFLPNGRIVLIAGEHEDSYDSDFCIYNDVFVREIDGTIRIFGYPKSIFPPTDFHTATLVGEGIYIIGNLGYHDERQIGTTPVYRLDTNSMRIDKIETKGECPGWIWKHRAQLTANGEILIQRGKIFNAPGAEDTELTSRHILDLSTREWRLAP